MAFLRHITTQVPDDELLVRFRQNGDLQVLADLYQRYLELIYGVCLKYLKVPEDAQDSTLSLFEEIGEKLQKHEVTNFKAWLYTVVKNHCLMKLRVQKRQPVVKYEEAFMQSEEGLHLNGVLEKEESFRQLEHCLGQLGAEQRTTIELFYLKGKCYNEIAEMTGLEWKQVRSYIQNGRRNLKNCMDAQQKKSLVE